MQLTHFSYRSRKGLVEDARELRIVVIFRLEFPAFNSKLIFLAQSLAQSTAKLCVLRKIRTSFDLQGLFHFRSYLKHRGAVLMLMHISLTYVHPRVQKRATLCQQNTSVLHSELGDSRKQTKSNFEASRRLSPFQGWLTNYARNLFTGFLKS